MTEAATDVTVATGTPGAHRAALPVLLGAGFTAAVLIRAALAGPAGAASRPAALVFAALLVVFVVAARLGGRPTVSPRAVAIGLAGAALLAAPAVVARGWSPTAGLGTSGSFASWAAITAVVATAEEAFLRGALFAALRRWRGPDVAVAGAAVAFAALHVPLYGWHVVPLDLAVGLVLGALRLAAGSWTAPAIAHVGADLVGWWLV